MTATATPERRFVAEEVALIRAPNYLPALANMTRGYPMMVGAHRMQTAEHLYQASKLRHRDRSQVLRAATARQAKAASYAARTLWHPRWYEIRIPVMRWCLVLKLHQHWELIAPILVATDPLSIVEWSRRDNFWGALPQADGALIGLNHLGALWEELRNTARAHGHPSIAERATPPAFLDDDWVWPDAT